MPQLKAGGSTAVLRSTAGQAAKAPGANSRLFPLVAIKFDYKFTAAQLAALTGNAARKPWEDKGKKKFRADVGDSISLRATENPWGKTYSVELWINDPTVLSPPRGVYAAALEIISVPNLFVGGD